MKSRSTGWFAGLGGLVLVIAIAVGARLWTKNSDSSDVKQKMHQVVRGIDSDPGNQAYLEGLVDRFHPTAFEAAYNLGGRRQSNQFKAEAYLREMARQIRAAALADGKVNLAEQIRTE